MIVCQASAESRPMSWPRRLMRRVATQPLAWPAAACLDAGGNGASPGRQTIVVGRMPAT